MTQRESQSLFQTNFIVAQNAPKRQGHMPLPKLYSAASSIFSINIPQLNCFITGVTLFCMTY